MKKKSKKKKVVMMVIIILGLIMIGRNNDQDNKDNTSQMEEVKVSEEPQEINYGWTTNDYEEFYVALKMIADNYLMGYKLPLYNKWQFVKLDDEGRILATTDELTFKDGHEKHTVICVFVLAGEVKENGLHEKVLWNYFATDEKVYYNDGSYDGVFEK